MAGARQRDALRCALSAKCADHAVCGVLTRQVAAGEELCNSYCDIDQPVATRQRELLEYGFVCGCARCEREKAEAAATPQAQGKKRLK
eukprot:7388595-Prymnesium_polylepis.2